MKRVIVSAILSFVAADSLSMRRRCCSASMFRVNVRLRLPGWGGGTVGPRLNCPSELMMRLRRCGGSTSAACRGSSAKIWVQQPIFLGKALSPDAGPVRDRRGYGNIHGHIADGAEQVGDGLDRD